MAEAFDALLAAMRDELAALDTGEAGKIEAATAAKLDALHAARCGAVVAPDRLAEARALNALAATRTNMLLAGVDRRLAVLAVADARGASMVYGRDGRNVVAR